MVNVSLSCQLERAGIGCFAELKLEVMHLLATVNSCKLTKKYGIDFITVVAGRRKGKLKVAILPHFQMRSEGKKKTTKKERKLRKYE